MKYDDGSQYDGEWINDKIYGQGEFILAEGERHFGKWIFDQQQ
ncbi:unnamed protein product [Paramecium sonneborni]|uniref:MORN repeat protein n=1 Tax=Paramecium sonneborni TaxID=65129 RepID=A0A8S1NXR8_9CILI|nr:unnamed protein product [Paramecium sonneborni]